MSKLDFKKEAKSLYLPSSKHFSLIDVPTMLFLMIDGMGNPNTVAGYNEAIRTLYTFSYKLKFHSKAQFMRDYVVAPLEGFWWADDMSAFKKARLDEWKWTMMIRQPDWITPANFEEIKEALLGKNQPPSIRKIRMETYHEGMSVQTLHIGPYSEEATVLAEMHDNFLPAHGLEMVGKHHEIYLNDPRRTAPEKLKTILRQPVKPKHQKAGPIGPASSNISSTKSVA